MQRVERHVCFDLEAFHQNRICFDEPPAKRAYFAHNVDQISIEELVDHELYEPIAEIVERPLVFVRVMSARTPVTHNHVYTAFNNWIDQISCLMGRISHICIDEQIDIGINRHECASQSIALALPAFIEHSSKARKVGQSSLRYRFGPVGRIVIDDINPCGTGNAE